MSQGSGVSGNCLVPSVEHFVHQTLGSDVFHVHLEWRFGEHRDRHVNTALLMPTTFYTVINKSN